METLESWNVFETTGRIEDYLNYRNQFKDYVVHTSETYSQLGEPEHGRANNINRDGIIGHANW